jgi:hypothetical protein
MKRSVVVTMYFDEEDRDCVYIILFRSPPGTPTRPLKQNSYSWMDFNFFWQNHQKQGGISF